MGGRGFGRPRGLKPAARDWGSLLGFWGPRLGWGLKPAKLAAVGGYSNRIDSVSAEPRRWGSADTRHRFDV